MSEPIRQVKGWRVGFDHPQGKVQAIDDVSFVLMAGERFGLARGSGSGKSTLAQAVLRMIRVRFARGEEEGVSAALLAEVGLSAAVARMYPHELSGGMKQRACIAIAICLRPQVIIADEPTCALDVVVQRQVMATLARVQRALGARGDPSRR